MNADIDFIIHEICNLIQVIEHNMTPILVFIQDITLCSSWVNRTPSSFEADYKSAATPLCETGVGVCWWSGERSKLHFPPYEGGSTSS